MQKVLILTPADLSHKVDVHYHHSVIDTIKFCAGRGIDVAPISWPGEALVQHARNALAREAILAKATSIVWIDADQEWTPEQFVRLLSHPVDVVGATYPKKQDREEYTFLAPPEAEERGGLLKVHSCATGFLRVSPKALWDVLEASEPYLKNDEQFRMLFDIQIVEGRLFGEDTVFSAKLTDAGYDIWLDPSFTVGHNGYKRYQGDVQAWLDRRQPAELAAGIPD